jgi:hypothetical protein
MNLILELVDKPNCAADRLPTGMGGRYLSK